MPFYKGDPNINRKGRPKNAEPELLREALKVEGEKRGVDFWTQVAKYAFTDKKVMIAVLKKFIPDKTITDIEGNLNFTIMPTITFDGKPKEFDVGKPADS